jgi:hypothetical protein
LIFMLVRSGKTAKNGSEKLALGAAKPRAAAGDS